ncbi:MAG TPA: glucose 1-dehydrogenase [Phycisphaerae bacterium]|nr:glucose 1-dehydrogenase [Phycisphaerae bacterium]
MNAFSLEDQIALITGGSSGLGLAMGWAMAEAGATVLLTGRREHLLREAAAGIGERAHALVHDATDLASAPELLERAVRAAGRAPTILVNNAGINMKKPALETTDEEFARIHQTNTAAAFALTRTFARPMIEARHGSILFIASMASLFGIPGVVAYSSSKSAMLGLVRTLAVELSPAGVRVNAIAPGWIETDMSKAAFANDPKRAEKILSRTPLQRLGQAEDVALAAVYLSGAAAKFVTGVCLPVDGGISIGF